MWSCSRQGDEPRMTYRQITVLVLALLVCLPKANAGTITPEIASLLQSSAASDRISVIVKLKARADVAAIQENNRSLRREKIINALQRNATASQRPLLQWLSAGRDVAGWKHLWMINAVAVTVPASMIPSIAARDDVEVVALDSVITAAVTATSEPTTPEWNLDAVNAPALWAQGVDGQGIVVATMDTGVDGEHQDIASRWRGGANSWYDPNGEHATPYDANGHGTQTLGLIVGGNAGGTSIGMAPGAQWISAKIFDDSGVATLSGIHQGFQWMLDPDASPATDDAPDIINNSWNLLTSVNACDTEFQPDIQVLRLADIAVMFAAGNSGPYPDTSISPANNAGALAVGAVDQARNVGMQSSRGPSACDGGLFPHLAAPGINVRTSDLTFGGVIPDSYATVSGTSFAVAHASGAAALLRSAHVDATVDTLESALLQSATDLGAAGDDNDYGHGLLNASAANDILGAGPVDADGDGYPVTTDCNDADADIHPGATEVVGDGVDQDCNGYDLTISVTKASYNPKRDSLSVEATSDLGKDAALQVQGFGAMSWSRRKQLWSLSVRNAGGDPGSVTVTGIEGSVSVSTVAK